MEARAGWRQAASEAARWREQRPQHPGSQSFARSSASQPRLGGKRIAPGSGNPSSAARTEEDAGSRFHKVRANQARRRFARTVVTAQDRPTTLRVCRVQRTELQTGIKRRKREAECTSTSARRGRTGSGRGAVWLGGERGSAEVSLLGKDTVRSEPSECRAEGRAPSLGLREGELPSGRENELLLCLLTGEPGLPEPPSTCERDSGEYGGGLEWGGESDRYDGHGERDVARASRSGGGRKLPGVYGGGGVCPSGELPESGAAKSSRVNGGSVSKVEGAPDNPVMALRLAKSPCPRPCASLCCSGLAGGRPAQTVVSARRLHMRRRGLAPTPPRV